MEKKSIVLSIAVTFLMLVSAGWVGVAAAATPDYCICISPEKENAECFESDGYVIKVVKDNQTGDFPQIVDGDSLFKYRITRCDTRKKLVSLAGLLFPDCTPSLTPLSYSCSPVSCTGTTYTDGTGEPLTGFGFGLTTENTVRWSWLWPLKWPLGLPSGTGTVSIKMDGKVYASPNPMMVAVGLLRNDFPFGQILAPSCGLVTPPSFPAIVPQTIMSEVPLKDGLTLCLEFGDNSGCPTNGYTCIDANPTSPCVCNNKDDWEDAGALSDLQVQTGWEIKQVSTKPDARCPITYLKMGDIGETDPCQYVIVNGKNKKVCY